MIIPTRTIDDYFCSFIVKGVGQIIIEEQMFYLEPGVFFLIAPGIKHNYILQDDPARYTFRFKLKSGIADRGFGAGHFIEEKAWGLQTTIMSLSQELQLELPYTRHRKKHLLAMLCMHVFRNEQKPIKDPTVFNEFQCRRISDFLAANVNNRPTPTDLAATLELTPDYFSRIFKHTYKVSPREWLVRERIRLASLELTDSTSNISNLVDAEFYGGGLLPSATPEPIVYAVKEALKCKADRHDFRPTPHDQTKWGGTPWNINEIMLVAGAAYCWDPEPDMDDLWKKWSIRRFGHKAAEILLPILKKSYTLMSKGFTIEKLDVLYGWHLAPKAWLGITKTNYNRFDLFRKPGIRLVNKTEDDEIFSNEYAAWQCGSQSVPIADVRNDQWEAMILIERGLNAIELAKTYLKSDDYDYLHEIYDNAEVILKAVMLCYEGAYTTQIMLDNYDNVDNPKDIFEEALKNLTQYADVVLSRKGHSFLRARTGEPALYEALREIAQGYREKGNNREQ